MVSFQVQQRRSTADAYCTPATLRRAAVVLSLSPPTLRECRHRGLARRLIAMDRRAILVIIERERPHPRHAHRHSGCPHDPADDAAVGEHVAIIVAGWATIEKRCR